MKSALRISKVSSEISRSRNEHTKKQKHTQPTTEHNRIHFQNTSMHRFQDASTVSTHSKQNSFQKEIFSWDSGHPSMYNHRKNEKHNQRLWRRQLYFALCSTCCIGLLLCGLAAIATFLISSTTASTTTLTSSASIATTLSPSSSSTAITSTISVSFSTSTTSVITTTTPTSNPLASSTTTVLITLNETSSTTTEETINTTTNTETSSTSTSSISTVSTTSLTTTKTTTTTSQSTTTYTCSSSAVAALGTLDAHTSTTETNWTQYAYSYTATKTDPSLVLAVDASNEMYILIDDVSVVDTTDPSVQLLDNPSFENSSTTYTDWFLWCTHKCNPGYGGTIITGSECLTGNCYKSHCNNGGADYLVQTFPAIINQVYNISLWFRRARDISTGSAKLYIGIL